jgi:Rho termination factor, N-terminal domain
MKKAVTALGAGTAIGVVGGVAYARLRNGGEGDSLESMTKDELYKRAQEADIPGRSDMTKDELVRALRSAS